MAAQGEYLGRGVRHSCGAVSSSHPTTENPEAPIYGRRIRAAPAAASACRQRLPSICGTSADSKNSGTSIYGSRIRVLFGGSRWLSARPTGGSKCVQAQPACEESGGSNLWPTDSCSVRRQQPGAGSACRQQVAVGTADQAQPADSKWQSAAPTVNPRKISWIRRPWPLQFMAANGRQ